MCNLDISAILRFWGLFYMRKIILAAAFLMAPVISSPAFADGHLEAETREMLDQDWHQVNLVRFHEGKQGRAYEILDMFVQAREAVGREPSTIVHFNTGDFHMMHIIPMEAGIAQMGWEDSARNDEWWNAFVEIAGGADEAEAIWEEYPTLMAERQRQIGHTH
jgi:hypothetical protein